jgi:hypothetical protein
MIRIQVQLSKSGVDPNYLVNSHKITVFGISTAGIYTRVIRAPRYASSLSSLTGRTRHIYIDSGVSSQMKGKLPIRLAQFKNQSQPGCQLLEGATLKVNCRVQLPHWLYKAKWWLTFCKINSEPIFWRPSLQVNYSGKGGVGKSTIKTSG